MEFKKYNSIENSYRKEYVERVAVATLNSNVFIVQEKVHGSNFSLITDGKDLESAKRTSLLLDTDSFYNHKFIKNKYYDKMQGLFKAIKDIYPNTNSITVFGELFGGSYPNVTKPRDAIKVQKGVFYAPYNEFYAFDIMINQETYLDVGVVNQLFEKYDFFYAKTLFKGTLKEALEYPNTFDSKIPKWLGLPKIENNICEGVIIKPDTPSFLPNGSRVIIKNKNAKWSEKSRKIKSDKVTKLSRDGEALMSELRCYINSNRLANVMSKDIDLEKNIGKLIGLLSKDAFEDFLKEHKNAFEALEKVEQKRLTKQLNQFASKLVKKDVLKLY